MFNYKAIVNVLGLLVALSGVAMLLAVPFSIYYGSTDLYPILAGGLGATLLGGLVWWLTQKGLNSELRKKDGYLVVTLGWIVMSLIGALPYYLAKFSIGDAYPIQTFTDAFFETMSGFTTTGASILGEQIEDLPKGLHFWRAMTHWIGGMGIIVLTIAILPLLGIGGMQLYAAEVPGPTPDKLTPRVKETAKRLWIIYFALTAIELVLLWLGDMNFYEAVCHSMGTLSTGGFSTSQASMGGFSAYSQYVVTIFMFLAGTNFALTYFAVLGKPQRLWANEEFRWYLYMVLFLIAVVTGVLLYRGEYAIEESFRAAAFQVISVVTTTGFGTEAFTQWGNFLMVLFFVLMFSGACAGSTSGGIKFVRSIVVAKNTYLELRRQVHPKAIMPVRFNGKAVSTDVVSKIMAFFVIFLLLFVTGSFVMSFITPDFSTAVGSVVASLGNIGPGIGEVGPQNSINFAAFPPFGKWFLSFYMLLGRLELFTVLMVITPFFWREK